jgi:hypothetical protein
MAKKKAAVTTTDWLINHDGAKATTSYSTKRKAHMITANTEKIIRDREKPASILGLEEANAENSSSIIEERTRGTIKTETEIDATIEIKIENAIEIGIEIEIDVIIRIINIIKTTIRRKNVTTMNENIMRNDRVINSIFFLHFLYIFFFEILYFTIN